MASPESLESSLPPESSLGGRWTIDRELRGAMGTVLLLTDPASGSRYAAKTPLIGRGLSRQTLERFAVEARTWLSLGRSPHVVEAFFLEEIEFRGRLRPFLFLEFVDGPTLDRLLELEGPLAVPVVLDVATGIAWGMSHAHGDRREGPRIVHRDLKPENVFLSADRVVKVSDFGIARALDRPDEVVEEGAAAGTPFYMAPEQLMDARAADRRSDVYAFGAVVHELLTGRPPFPAESLASLVWKVLKDDPEPVSSLRPGVPRSLDDLVLRCLAKDPRERPESFLEVLRVVSEVREIDELWMPQGGARSCAACGWLSVRPLRRCAVCGKRTGPALRYAPTSHRSHEAPPTLGRTPGAGGLVLEGWTVHPRLPRAGEEVVVTVLLGNSAVHPIERVVVPFGLPDRHAFKLARGARRKRFVGTVPPTAPGAPLRVSWSLVPLREGQFSFRGPLAYHIDGSGHRVALRGTAAALQVSPRDLSPLVGRDGEITALRGLLQDARRREGAAALVLGRPGSGKSRLVREIWDEASDFGFARVRARCLGRSEPVRGALREIARQILRLPRAGTSPREAAAAMVVHLADQGASSLAVREFVIDEMLGRPVPRGASAAEMWARFACAAAAKHPLLLVLEDVQRDPQVGRVALAMARLARRERVALQVVLSARWDVEGQDPADGDPVRALERAICGTDAGVVVHLVALTADEVRDFVDAVFQPNDFGTTVPWLTKELAQISGGNPLFLTEVVEALRREGPDGSTLVRPLEGCWTASAHLTQETLRTFAPESLDEVVLSRLAGLTDGGQAFVEAAGVLGDVFRTDRLRGLLGDPPWFAEALAELEGNGTLREWGGSPGRIRFREPLVPEILRRDLAARDPRTHRRLHGLAADGLLATASGGSSGVRPRGGESLRLARHLKAAGRLRPALDAYLDAVERLVERQAYARGRAVLAEALRLLDGDLPVGRRTRVRFRTLEGEILRFTGDFRGALDAYRAVVDEGLLDGADVGALGTVYSKMGKVYETLGELDDALYCYSVGLTLREENGLEFDVPMSLANLAGLHARKGNVDQAAELLEQALACGAATGNARALSAAHVLEARLATAVGRTAVARAGVRAALRAARQARSRRGSAAAWSALGAVNFLDGRLGAALRWFERALRLRQDMGDRAAVAASWTEVGAVREASGELEPARVAYLRAVELSREIGLERGAAPALTSLGRVQFRTGRLGKAFETLEHACTLGKGRGEPAAEAVARALLSTTARYTGACAVAAEQLEEARRLVRNRQDHETWAAVALTSAQALREAGEREQSLERVEEALGVRGLSPSMRVGLLSLRAELTGEPAGAEEAMGLAESGTNPRARARALAARGRVELVLGDPDGAAALLRRAVALLLQTGERDPLTLGVLVDQARALADRNPAAAAAARRRADELRDELVRAGAAPDALPGFPLEGVDGPPVGSAALPGGAPKPVRPESHAEGAPSNVNRSFIVHLPNDLSRVPHLRERFEAFIAPVGLSVDDLQRWNLVFTELVNNSLEHGCSGPDDQIEVAVTVTTESIELCVTDPSVGGVTQDSFDNASSDGFLESGRGAGLFLVRQLTDTVVVEVADGGGTRVRAVGFRTVTSTGSPTGSSTGNSTGNSAGNSAGTGPSTGGDA